MTREEMIAKAQVIRSRDRFGVLTPEEVASLPGTETVLQIPAGNGTVTVYEVRPAAPLKVGCGMIINYHGGGFLKGRTDRDHRYCSFLANGLGCLVWDVDYSLAPEYPYPTAVNESYDVFRYACNHASELHVNPAQIALAGHSAGGTLVAAVILRCGREGTPVPCCALMEYFVTDQQATVEDKLNALPTALREDPFWARRVGVEVEYSAYYLENEADVNDALCAPCKASDEELARFPDSLVIAAGTDTLRKDTLGFAARLSDNGVTVTSTCIPEAIHGFTVNRTEGWERALALHKAFFQYHLK